MFKMAFNVQHRTISIFNFRYYLSTYAIWENPIRIMMKGMSMYKNISPIEVPSFKRNHTIHVMVVRTTTNVCPLYTRSLQPPLALFKVLNQFSFPFLVCKGSKGFRISSSMFKHICVDTPLYTWKDSNASSKMKITKERVGAHILICSTSRVRVLELWDGD